MPQNNDLEHYEDTPEGQELRRLFQALRSSAETPQVPLQVDSKIRTMLAQQRTRRGLFAWWRAPWLFTPRPVLIRGALAAALCLSLAINGWLTFRTQHLQAQYVVVARQLAALQEAQKGEMSQFAMREQGLDLRGRTYTADVLAHALFSENASIVTRRGGVASPYLPRVVLPLAFAPGKAAMEPRYAQDLKTLGTVLTLPENATYKVQIAGHTDNHEAGTAAAALSLQRAEVVKRYLVQHVGIAPERLQVQGYGASNPLATNDTPEGRAQNRRVEVTSLKP